MSLVLFNLHDVVLLITAYLCLLFALLCLTRKAQGLSNGLLSAFLLCHAAIPLDLLVQFGDAVRPLAIEHMRDAFYVFGIAYWLEAPLLLLYTRSLLYRDPHLQKRDALFFLPALAYLFTLVPFFMLTDTEQVHMLQHSSVYDSSLNERIVVYVRDTIRLGFGLACVMEIQHYRTRIRSQLSNIDALDFSWLRTLVIGFVALLIWQMLVVLGIELNIGFALPVDFSTMGLIGNYATLALVSLLIFFSLSHSSVVAKVSRKEDLADGQDTSDQDTANQAAPKPPEFDSRDIARLSLHMAEQKPYLQANLTIDELAGQLNWSSRMLSQIINRHFECNFFEFVNRHRIEEAKHLLVLDDVKRSVLEVMYASGFNSKATFNTFFKKQTAMTPSEYRAKHPREK